MDKELSGEYEAYSFSNGDLVSIVFNRNKAIEYGKHFAPGRWLEFKVENKEEIDAWRRNTIDAMPYSDFERLDGLSEKLVYAEAKLEGRKSERDVSLAELVVQAEEAKAHQSKSNHSEPAVDAGIENWQSCCLKGI